MEIVKLIHIPTQNDLDVSLVDIVNSLNKYSDPVYAVRYKQIPIHKTNRYRVFYKCGACSSETSTLLCNYVKKLGKESKGCPSCLMAPHEGTKEVDKKLPKDAEELSLVLKNTSLRKYLEEPFDYHPAYGKGKHSEPVIKLCETNRVVRLANFDATCACCTVTFRAKTLCIHRLKKGSDPIILCSDCSQTLNNKPKSHGELEFMTKAEHKFIKYCENEGIPLENGTRVGMKRIAFYQPNLKTYIDVKSNVGWNERTRSVEGLCETIPLTQKIDPDKKYMIIYPKAYVAQTRTLKKQVGVSVTA